MEVGKRKIISISLHCHHPNDSCIKMGSDESHFTVPLIVRPRHGQGHKTVSTDHSFRRLNENAEPKGNRAETVLLGQTGSLLLLIVRCMMPELRKAKAEKEENNIPTAEFRSCVRVEVAVLGFPS